MKTWKATTSNDASPISVLKKLGLLSATGEPLQAYADYMQPPPAGPKSLGAQVRARYKTLFDTSHEPHKNASELRTFFNINSGGGERAIDYQVQTFKALSEYADFTGPAVLPGASENAEQSLPGASASTTGVGKLPPIQIDLHIHLPENKTARDYESIIQDIAKYIYGRTGPERG